MLYGFGTPHLQCFVYIMCVHVYVSVCVYVCVVMCLCVLGCINSYIKVDEGS